MNKIKLLFSALLKFSFGIIFVGLLLFLPAGTFDFFNAWLFMGLLFIPIFCEKEKLQTVSSKIRVIKYFFIKSYF